MRPDGFMLAALAHDFGKAVCTEPVHGVIHSYGHETEGVALAGAFLDRLTSERELKEYVLPLVRYHMAPNMLAAQHSSVKKTNHLFDSVPDPEALICLAEADGLGMIPGWKDPGREAFLMERLEQYRETMSRPYVTGRDLVEAGIRPSERFGEYLAFAHKLRLAGVRKESALKQTLSLIRKQQRRASPVPKR